MLVIGFLGLLKTRGTICTSELWNLTYIKVDMKSLFLCCYIFGEVIMCGRVNLWKYIVINKELIKGNGMGAIENLKQ